MIDTDRLATWLDTTDLPGTGAPIQADFVSGGTQNEIYEIRRGDLHGALRMPPVGAPEALLVHHVLPSPGIGHSATVPPVYESRMRITPLAPGVRER